MKIYENIKCPHCGGKDIHTYQRQDVSIWDDDFHKMLNNEYEKDNRLNCDTITYKCKCNEEECNKYFLASFKLKIKVEDVIIVKNEEELCNNYFKK